MASMFRFAILICFLAAYSSAFVAVHSARLQCHSRTAAASPVAMSLSKGELVEAVAARAGVSKKMAGDVLGSALDVIVESVANGDKVSLVGFGTFDSKARAAREGRNPKTGDKMQIEATVVPTFSFGKGFKDACKKSYLDSLQVKQLNGSEAPK